MLYRAILLSFFLLLAPSFAVGQEMPALHSQLLGVGKPAPNSEYAQYQNKRLQWSLISAGTLFVGTSALVTGVILFNRGDNAKKNAAGDALIRVGVGVDLAALVPLGVAYYWNRKLRSL